MKKVILSLAVVLAASAVPAQQLTKEQIKAISHYLDTPENRSREIFQGMVDSIW